MQRGLLRFVNHGEIKAWLLSLGFDHELPPPKCVCGDSQGATSKGKADPSLRSG